jgi:hypothetical protein
VSIDDFHPSQPNLGTFSWTASNMELRDYFAGQALATMKIPNWSDNPLYWEGVARSAYVCADAMLEARKVKP